MWLAPSHIVDGDNAELATLGTLGGTAHPTGYPLYLVWLRALAWLPGSPAHATGVATAILGAASMLVLHAACRAWGARPLAATIAVAVLAGAPLMIRAGTRAEVFALNNLVVAAVLWLAAREGPLRGGRRAFALGLIAGLGLSNHSTCVLVAPLGILGVIRGTREARVPIAAVALAIAGLVLGLVPYAYLFVTPETPLSWGAVRSIDDLIGMVTRRDYGGPAAFAPGSGDVSASAQLVALAVTLGRTWLWVPLVMGVFTLTRRSLRPGVGETRWAWALLAVSWLIAGPILAMRFNIEPVGLGLYVCQRFYLLPALLLAVPVAMALTELAARLPRSRIPERTACAIAATLGVLAAIGISLPAVSRVQTAAVEQYARNVLHSLPPNAVLLAGQEGEYFQFNYVQWARGERQDVVVVSTALLNLPWYAQRLGRRGVHAEPGRASVARTVDDLLDAGRPVFIEITPANVAHLLSTHPSYPYGPVVRVLPRSSAAPSIDDVVAMNAAIYEKFDLAYPRPGPDDEFATHVHERYAATWQTLAKRLDSLGRHEEAASALENARQLEPRSD